MSKPFASPDDRHVLLADELAGALAEPDLQAWAVDGEGLLSARFATGDFETGMRLLSFVAATAEEQHHHPDIDLRYSHVTVRMTTRQSGGLTQRDLRLARAISEYADGDHIPSISAV